MDSLPLLTELFRLTEIQKKGLKKLRLETARDLLFHFPARYVDPGAFRNVAEIKAGETVTLQGQVSNLKVRKGFRSKIPMGEADFEDLSGKIKIIWFNQPYLAKMTTPGQIVRLTGRVSQGKQGIYLANPEIGPAVEPVPLFGKNEPATLLPVYSETRGLTSKWIFHAVQKILKGYASGEKSEAGRKIFESPGAAVGGGREGRENFPAGVTLADYLPAEILKKYNLPSLRTALVWIHTPRKAEDATAARKRFAFEEVFFIQLKRQKERQELAQCPSFHMHPEQKIVDDFVGRFPFRLTGAQKRALEEILKDFASQQPMSRLLEGDVGSGKTAVAAVAAFAAAITRPPSTNAQGKQQDFGALQTAYMAPTEILANQHFESFIECFKHLPVNIGLITSSVCKKFPSKVNMKGWTTISRAQLLKWVANGEIPILIGTHALIQKSVRFKDLAFVVIDEQHRFGTAQRRKLTRKTGPVPHLLSMTATPIPRTLALTIYGDLDLTLLDEMPAGRKQVLTEIVSPENRAEVYEKIEGEMKKGRQVFVICPRIDEPDPAKEMALQAKSVKAEAERLKKEMFPKRAIEILHSKMSRDKKEKVMKDFVGGETDILVATSVVEVGVNVPNATIIIIEGAERFGLAQLHQLRGRVLRSVEQAYCYIFTDSKNQKALDRLKALGRAKNGFELAEMDLELRGAGELGGGKQWGISDIGMEALKNLKMVEAARAEALVLVLADSNLKNHPRLAEMLHHRHQETHFE